MKVETKETMCEKDKALDNSVDAKAQVPNYCGEFAKGKHCGSIYKLDVDSPEELLEVAEEILASEENADDRDALADGLMFKADALYYLKKYEEALATVDKLEEIGGALHALELKSQILLLLGRYDESLEVAKRAYIDPEDALAAALIAHNLIVIGRYGEANLLADWVQSFNEERGLKLKLAVIESMPDYPFGEELTKEMAKNE